MNQGQPQGPRRGWALAIGGALAAVAVTAILLNFMLPWLALSFPGPDGSKVAMRDDLRDPDAVPYEQALLTWPLTAYATIAALGVLLVASAFLPPELARRALALHVPGLWLLALAGFLLALTGTRWLGFFWTHLAQPGPAFSRLHAVPYVNLGNGVVLLAGAVALLLRRADSGLSTRGPDRWAAWSAAAAGAGLLLAPLLPYAKARSSGYTFLLDEFALAALAAQGSRWDLQAPQALAWARGMAWAALAASLLTLLALHAARYRTLPKALRWTVSLQSSIILLVAAGAFFVTLFYSRLSQLRGDPSAAFNPFLPAALVVLGALVGLQWRAARRRPRRRSG